MSSGSGCPSVLGPICDVGSALGSAVGGAVGSVTNGVTNGVLSAVVGWVVGAANWLLHHIATAMETTTEVRVRAPWFESHYATMATIAAVVAVPMLLLAAVQAVYQQSPGVLMRAAVVHLPLAGVLTGVGVQLVQLGLTVTNVLCAMVAKGSSASISSVLDRIGTVLVSEGVGPMPGFVVTVGGLLIVAGALVLWLELLVRAAAVYVAVLFLPLALASLVWPAVSHWCRRLVETIAALVLSKFVVVAVLTLAVGAIGSGSGFHTVLAGGALLLLATFAPYTVLRLLPMLEVGAALQLESARHRVGRAVTAVPMTAASFALGKLGRMTPGPFPDVPGTFAGAGEHYEAAGSDDEPTFGPDGPPGLPTGGRDPRGSGPGGGRGARSGDHAGASEDDAAALAWASLPPEHRGDGLVPPPGGIGIARGDPVGTRWALDWLAASEVPVPDGAGGGMLPGVERPFYDPSGTAAPSNRFRAGVPGPPSGSAGPTRVPAGPGTGPAPAIDLPRPPSVPPAPGERWPEPAEELWSPADEPPDPDHVSEGYWD